MATKEILEARVMQKKDTEANWLANPLILLAGEQAFVVSSSGAPMNFKIGDGTKRFSELPYWIKYDQAAWVSIQGTVLPSQPAGTVKYSLLGPGTYTQSTGGSIVVPSGNMSSVTWNGTNWVKGDNIPFPVAESITDWTAQAYVVGKQVYYAGNIWVSNAAAVAGDIPGVSAKWTEKVGGVKLDENNGALGYNSYKLRIPAVNKPTVTIDWDLIGLNTGRVSSAGIISSVATTTGRYSNFIPVNKGDVITGQPYAVKTSNVISFYTAADVSTYVSGVVGAGATGTSTSTRLSFTFEAPANGYIVLYQEPAAAVSSRARDPKFIIGGNLDYYSKLVTEDSFKPIAADSGINRDVYFLNNYTTSEYGNSILRIGRYPITTEKVGDTYTQAYTTSYVCARLKVIAGDKFSLECNTASGVARYILLDSDNKIVKLSFSDGGVNTVSKIIEVSQDGTLIINTSDDTIPLAAATFKFKRLIPKDSFTLGVSNSINNLNKNDLILGKEVIENIAFSSFSNKRMYNLDGLIIGSSAPLDVESGGRADYSAAGKIKVKKGEVLVFRVKSRPDVYEYALVNSSNVITQMRYGGQGVELERVINIVEDGFLLINAEIASNNGFDFKIWSSDFKKYRVLVIGNSYSEMPLRYLQDLVDMYPQIDQRNMCVYAVTEGGSPLSYWLGLFRENASHIAERKAGKLSMNAGGMRDRVAQYWDLITFHQQSALSTDRASIDASLPKLIEYVKTYCPNKNVKIGWNIVQSSPATGGVETFEQIKENAIYVKNTYGIDYLNPFGLAIENLRKTSYIGANSGTSDNSHLAAGTPLYVAAGVWFEFLFNQRYGVSFVGNSMRINAPGYDVTDSNAKVLQLCARSAYQSGVKTADWIQAEVESYNI